MIDISCFSMLHSRWLIHSCVVSNIPSYSFRCVVQTLQPDTIIVLYDNYTYNTHNLFDSYI